MSYLKWQQTILLDTRTHKTELLLPIIFVGRQMNNVTTQSKADEELVSAMPEWCEGKW